MSNTISINDHETPNFAVRLICADSYQTTPIGSLDQSFSEFRGSEIKYVPIIRIFGTTRKGKKVCLHIHGVFPYIYIPCSCKDNVDKFMYQLASSLDAAINISLNSANSNTQHVYKIQLISAIPLYGFHKKKHKFFKIYFYNPAMIKKATDLLQSGSVLNQAFQPHEAHIPYILQFMMDYNIYGMSFVNLQNIYYRGIVETTCEKSLSSTRTETLSEDCKIYLPNSVLRQSTCELEVDAIAADILNRRAIENGIDTNPGIAAIWEEEKLRRDLAGLPATDSQIKCSSSLLRKDLPPTDNDIYQEQRYNKRLLVISQDTDFEPSPLSFSESYASEVEDEDDNLLNASVVEDHLFNSIHNERNISSQTKQLLTEDFSSSFSNEQVPENNSILDVDDMSLVEMLSQLAKDAESQLPVDNDSVLGSQKSVVLNEEDLSDNEDEVPDLNLTSLQLDSLSSWDLSIERPQSCTSNISINSIPTAAFDESFSVPSEKTTADNDNIQTNQSIPAFDGPLDDVTSDSDQETDVTVQSIETRVCVYNPNNEHLLNTTPRKRRFSEDNYDDTNLTLKRTKVVSHIHRTPTRSPRRMSSLQSPSSSRKYSPLNIVVSSPKTGENLQSPKISKKDKIEKSICKSISNVSALQKIEEDEILADDSDDSTAKGTAEYVQSPISAHSKTFRASKETARKLTFSASSNEDSSSQDTLDLQLQNQEKNDVVSETSEETPCNSENDDFQSTPTVLNTRTSFSRLLSLSKANDGCISLVPKYMPPNRQRIIDTMELYGIPKCRYQEPFCGDQEDVVGYKEVAQTILKVRSKGLMDLALFTSNLENVRGIAQWRQLKFEELQATQNLTIDNKAFSIKRNLAGHSLIRIVPLIMPPSSEKVITWIRAREYLRKKKKLQKDQSTPRDKKELPLENSIDEENDDSNEDRTLCASTDSQDDTIIEQHKDESLLQSKDSSKVHSSNKTESSIDSTVQRALNDSKLFPETKTSKHFGISCGQIEALSNETRGHVDDENMHARTLAQNQYITIMCLEVHVLTREDFIPDPQKDEMKAIFYAIQDDIPSSSLIDTIKYGVIVVDSSEKNNFLPKNYITNITYAKSEKDMVGIIVSLITRYDPEILIGWELETLSWGYVFQRAAQLGFNLSARISRIPNIKISWEARELDLEALSEIKLPGRIVLDIWRIMRHEIALTNYTFENVMYHIMNERLPFLSWKNLSRNWNSENCRLRCKVVDYYTTKVLGILRILDHLDIIGRTSEFARLYGVQFYEVFSRGSQYRVESMMLRLAKPLNYIPVSPSSQQRIAMRAPEALPLIMEPESRLYNDPVVVLDFQSLYPSIIIAYNYCFSTCIGRIEHIGQSRPFVFGAATLKVPKKLALELQGKVNFSPCGVGFVKPEVRQGILPQMLTEILNTRLMVKKAIKDHSSDDKTLQRVLHSRQLGLKLIANVTYGYTAANFSGRMPCIEVGDSVVSKGKETLERAIKIVESTSKWGARVVYGDTDSLFVLLQGKSRKEAFKIGAEIADAVTNANPTPVKLKFEKILQPAILQTKKRYCGYMYETEDVKEPVYLAKGIETVRRDGCPAVSKILAKSLKILFETKDISLIKKYVTRQFDKILQGRVSIQDLIFAREFRGLRGYKPNACVPALELTRRLMQKDPRAIPRNSERVSYVIVAGAPNEPLIRCVRTPMEVLTDPSLRPNAIYYITRVIIPPLNRCLQLIGVDVFLWFNRMTRQIHKGLGRAAPLSNDKQKLTISQYFGPATCIICEKQTVQAEICEDCIERPSETIITLNEKLRQMERVNHLIKTICHSCMGQNENIDCESLDCPVFYRRAQSRKDLINTFNASKYIHEGFKLDYRA